MSDAPKIKAKGAYGYNPCNLNSKAVNRICIDAMQSYFIHGIPVEQTVRACDQIEQFISYFKCPRGHALIGDDGVNYGALARWYIGRNGVRLNKTNLQTGKETKIEDHGATVIVDLPEILPGDIDYAWYSARAEALVKEITEPQQRYRNTVPLGELSMAQRARLGWSQTAVTADPERCSTIALEPLQEAYSGLIKGHRVGTMYHCLLLAWMRGRGRLGVGDLLWLGATLDAAFDRRHLARMAAHISRRISPFPLPQTLAEHAHRAWVWAQETVEPVRPRKVLRHRSVMMSDYLTGDSIRHYAKHRDDYKLACRIAAVARKHRKAAVLTATELTVGDGELDEDQIIERLIVTLIGAVRSYLQLDLSDEKEVDRDRA